MTPLFGVRSWRLQANIPFKKQNTKNCQEPDKHLKTSQEPKDISKPSRNPKNVSPHPSTRLVPRHPAPPRPASLRRGSQLPAPGARRRAAPWRGDGLELSELRARTYRPPGDLHGEFLGFLCFFFFFVLFFPPGS